MRRVILAAVLILTVAFLVTGCKKSLVKGNGTGPDGTGTGTTMGDGTGDGGRGDGISGAEGTTGTGSPDNFIDAVSMGYKDIYFDFDRFNIKESAKPNLRELARWLMQNNAKVAIEGHCDERGTNEYNLALGDRRANSARDFLIASGVPSSKIETISYGEEKPQCSAKTESCWSKNRRAHFVILKAR